MACPPLCDNFDPADDRFVTAESPTGAVGLVAAAAVAATGGVVLGAAGALAAGETVLTASSEAVGPLITSEKAAAVARVALASNLGQKAVRVFTGENFRLGVSRAKDGGRFVFRAAGTLVERVLGRPKLDIMDLGRIEDFMKALGRR